MKINNIHHFGESILTIEDFWTTEKCDAFIAMGERIGYSEALVQTDLGPRRIDHIRNNLRIIYDNEELANDLWEDLKNIAPKKVGNSISIGLNERFRFYKYTVGQSFKRHRDQSYIRNEKECSYYTFMIYLNDDYEGGATSFYNLSIQPKKGMALIFYHPLDHEGGKIHKGVKYILRTDIMYRLEGEL
ncbi:MAG: 2OG-Fe(II) oxygenase [Saprospiraceae bacterium]|nr:2OG-Fe(II) oxygenase [Saprospiraceae bacterium]